MNPSEAEDGPSVVSRLAVVGTFVAVCVGIFSFLWINSGGRLPLVSSGSTYQVTAEVPEVANLVYFSDVMIAGVKVGKVRDVTEKGDHAEVLMEIDEDVAPLHENATVEIRAKSLVEESFISVTDGDGAEIESGGRLKTPGTPATQLDDVLDSLDEPTRAVLGEVVRSAGAGVADSSEAVAAAAEGLGDLGREGEDVLDALAAQGEDLTSLTRSTTRVLDALASRQDQLSQLVTNAETLSAATAGQAERLSEVIRGLPDVMGSARTASSSLKTLGGALTPVAVNLDAAAEDLNAALEQLPRTSADLRGLLPSLDAVLSDAPATLDRVPTLSDDVDALVPAGERVLADANPILAYLEPFGPEIAAFFTGFGQSAAVGDEHGRYIRALVPFNEQSLKGIPLNTNVGPLDKFAPLPLPGSLADPGPHNSLKEYPRVTRDAIPE